MSEDEAAIRKVAETLMTSSQTGDIDTVPGLLTDDAIFRHQPKREGQFLRGAGKVSS